MGEKGNAADLAASAVPPTSATLADVAQGMSKKGADVATAIVTGVATARLVERVGGEEPDEESSADQDEPPTPD